MGLRYPDIAFTPSVKALQEARGSRDGYALRDEGDEAPAELGPDERAFIADRDGFYIATLSETGWPYVQFRGGLPGFLRIFGAADMGFADFLGNRQYVTAGNVASDDRISLFLMDYLDRRRLKVFGRMRTVEREDDPDLVDSFAPPNYPATVERASLIRVEAFDWNCPRHITPRFTIADDARDPAVRDRMCAEARLGPKGTR